jgi:hypothetical protein
MAFAGPCAAQMEAGSLTFTFAQGKRGIQRLPRPDDDGGWTLYGRFYLVNFKNELDEPEARMRFTVRRTGPRISNARVYVGVVIRF